MKILTREEEDAHYRAVVTDGTVGGIIGLVGGLAGVMAASKRYSMIRNLTIPMKSFLVTSSGTFFGIVAADRASRGFEAARNQELQWFESREARLREEELAKMSFVDRVTAFAREERYAIVGLTWVASMIGSFVVVGRSPHLTGQQKIVQARVYAQGLTLAVLVASAAFEISDQRKARAKAEAARKEREVAKGDETHPTAAHEPHSGDLWKDLVAAEEERLKQKHLSLYEKHEHGAAGAHSSPKKEEEEEEKEEQK